MPRLVERCHFSVTSLRPSTAEQTNPARILCLKMWDPGVRKTCKFDFPLFKVVMAQMEREKRKHAPELQRRNGGCGVCSAWTPQAPWGRVEDEINLYLSVGCEQPQAAIAPKALMLYSEKTYNNPFQCLVVLTGFAILLTNVTRIANTFVRVRGGTYLQFIHEKSWETAQSLKMSDAKLMR